MSTEHRVMRRIGLVGFCTAVALLAALAGCSGADDGDGSNKINGSIHVTAGKPSGSVATVNGSIHVDDNATITSASTVNGSVHLDGHATADSLTSVNGSITLGAGARVSGAVSSVNGSAPLKVPGEGPDPGATMETGLILRQHQSHNVRTVTLDSYFEKLSRRIAVIKCDVEGHELAVFQGAATILRRDKPALIFECEERHHRRYSNREVFRYLTDLGYEGFFFAQNRRHPVAQFNVVTHGNPEGENYINNFVFLWAGS